MRDETLRLLRDGYRFGERGFARSGEAVFETRLLGRPAMVIRGLDAARFFYEGGRFDRSPGSVPRSAVRLLQDDRSVQSHEGPQHAQRKQLFLDALDDHAGLVDRFRDAWLTRASTERGPVPLLQLASELLTEAVNGWAGVADDAIAPRELTSMVEHAGSVGPPNWLARIRRLATERRARRLVHDARRQVADGTPVSRIARHEESGRRLPTSVAAVELLNLLRPTVAVARFIAFAGVALHERPDLRAGLAADPALRARFAEEVRRRFPFFPMIGGHATRQLSWAGRSVPRGGWVLLDLYGTDHDPDVWRDPDRFDPARFSGSATPVVAQGIGERVSTHHCPGVPATSHLMQTAVELLVAGPAYRVPDQDLRISLRRFPAAPKDGFVIEFV